jgi:hypothetical protein
VVSRAPLAVDKVVSADTPWQPIAVKEPLPIVSRAPLAVEKVVSADTPWQPIPVKEPSPILSRAPLAVEKVVSADKPWRLKKQRKDTPAVTLKPSADISWRQNQNQGAPKAPPRSKKSASPGTPSPVNKRGLARLPSDTEEGASNLIASCEQYLDENPVTIINPFLGLQKMDESADIHGSNTSLAAQRRKLSSVSDIRDSIKETHEDAGSLSYGAGCQTVPRAFSPRSVSVSPMVSRARTQPMLPAVSLASAVSEARGVAAAGRSRSVANRRPSGQGLYKRQDGTESVRSFVIVSNNSTLDLNSDTEESNSFGLAAAVGLGENSDEESWSDNDDSYNKSNSDFQNNSKNPRNKGFVNKCVSRVKSLVNPAKN